MEVNKKYGFGLWPQQKDDRDFKFRPTMRVGALPAKVSWQSQLPPVWNQGETSSCTGFAFSAAVMHGLKKQGKEVVNVSRLFDYYNARVLQNSAHIDAGAYIRDLFKVAKKFGFSSERLWPFSRGRVRKQPVKAAYEYALRDKIDSYRAVFPTVLGIKQAIADGYVVVGGILVYDSLTGLEVAQSGVMPMPTAEDKLLGGHAVVFCGYDDAKSAYLVRNSWGREWGQSGYFWIPYSYQEISDCWVIEVV